MDEIKTKFSVGDNVWYIKYAIIAHKCPHCGELVERYNPTGIDVGTVKTIFLQISEKGIAERYELQIPWMKGKPLFTERSADEIFPDNKTAYRRYKEALEENGYEE